MSTWDFVFIGHRMQEKKITEMFSCSIPAFGSLPRFRKEYLQLKITVTEMGASKMVFFNMALKHSNKHPPTVRNNSIYYQTQLL
jgi:hypothetical protein